MVSQLEPNAHIDLPDGRTLSYLQAGADAGPVVTAPVPAAFMKAMAARIDQSLAVGNEGAGLPGDLVRSSDAVVSIPQNAARESGVAMDSLNAAIAGAILLYEAASQRGLGKA